MIELDQSPFSLPLPETKKFPFESSCGKGKHGGTLLLPYPWRLCMFRRRGAIMLLFFFMLSSVAHAGGIASVWNTMEEHDKKVFLLGFYTGSNLLCTYEYQSAEDIESCKETYKIEDIEYVIDVIDWCYVQGNAKDIDCNMIIAETNMLSPEDLKQELLKLQDIADDIKKMNRLFGSTPRSTQLPSWFPEHGSRQ